ncbi:hypothetical protein GGX14DRAFT_575723 [Mycena pura]|uniref:Uncharacterized protein n=1 Tax=Mycena pura TaxID=153505 RepID=A0AAD6UUN1_9AGAR|nr:hypothetical protein GGX14DRAFT_575723 [Mycena pura]
MSRSSSPAFSTPQRGTDDLLAAMDEDTPTVPIARARKRARTQGGSSSDEDDDILPTTNVVPGRNDIDEVRRIGAALGLRGEQVTQALSPSLLGAVLILQMHALEKRLVAAAAAAKPDWKPKDDKNLMTNINAYAIAILLSPRLSAYKGDVAKDILMDILEKNPEYIPVGTFKSHAERLKLLAVVGAALTQMRSNIKKAIEASLGVDKKDHKKNPLPPAEHNNIFELCQVLVKGTQCSVTIELCARVALMRANYDKTEKMWNKLDAELDRLRKAANGDVRKLNRAFRRALDNDRNGHGNPADYTLPAESVHVGEVQAVVDSTIDGVAMDKASSLPGEADDENAGAGEAV